MRRTPRTLEEVQREHALLLSRAQAAHEKGRSADAINTCYLHPAVCLECEMDFINYLESLAMQAKRNHTYELLGMVQNTRPKTA